MTIETGSRQISRRALASVLLLGPSLLGLMRPSLAGAAPRPLARKVLMLVQMAGPNRPVDDKVVEHLTARGYAVTLGDQDAHPRLAAGYDLIVISSTVSAKAVDPGWRHVATPLLTWENDILDDLAMTGKRHDADFGEVAKERYLWIVNAPHPMAAGVPAGVADVYIKQGAMSWGRPGLGATTIATLYGEPEKAAIFGYERGATMDYESLAPARRVMIFLDNDSFTNLSPAGLALFDAAVDWTVAGGRDGAS